MHYLFPLLLVTAAPTLQQALTKPLIQPPIDFSKIDQGLLDHLKPTYSTQDAWGPGWIPRDCKVIVEANGLSGRDVEVFNVHYVDVSGVGI